MITLKPDIARVTWQLAQLLTPGSGIMGYMDHLDFTMNITATAKYVCWNVVCKTSYRYPSSGASKCVNKIHPI